MPTINERLATLERAVSSITGGGNVTTVTTVVQSQEDELQNNRLANAEANIAATDSSLSGLQASLAITLAEIQAALDDLDARVLVLEATSYGVEAPAGLATGTGIAYSPAIDPSTPSVYVYPGYATGTGTAYGVSVSGPPEGTSTTYALPFRLGT